MAPPDAHALRPLEPEAIARELGLTALIGFGLALPMIGLRTVDDITSGLIIEARWGELALAVLFVVAGRLGLIMTREGRPLATLIGGAIAVAIGWFATFPTATLKVACIAGGAILAIQAANALRRTVSGRSQADRDASSERRGLLLQRAIPLLAALAIAFAIALPFLPPLPLPGGWVFDPTSRYVIDVATLIMTYVMLGWGLNIIVGYAGLLDLGYVAFYAVGAYSYALLAQYFDISFWLALPLAGLFAATAGIILGFPVLRLRGDYFAIVTLGFGEIIRIIVINWWWVTGGPDGISGIPRPDFFGLAEFSRRGDNTFHDLMGIEFDSTHRLIFLYYLILALSLLVAVFTIRIRNLPIGRAWEALREDEIACASLGIDRTRIKLAAFGISAMWGGFAGAFFATRQGFISPESFTFIESAIILAIVVMGGMGSLFGVALAAVVLIGVPEIFRELSEFRMLAFGAGLVLIMLWRPRGLLSHRDPSVKLFDRSGAPPPDPGLAPAARAAK